MSVLFSNNASTTLSAGVGNSATSITVADGSVFPSISGSDYFYVTLEVDSDSDLKEIVKVTARSGNTLTITRGQDGTSARTFSSGDKCELRLNAAALNDAVVGNNTTEMLLNQFTGDGSTTSFTLSNSPDENLTNVFLSGVYQSKSNYSISGSSLTFSTAPPNGLPIEVMVAKSVEISIATPADGSVTTAKIADDAVTSDKLSNALSTKIAGIEASADVTDTANVTAAGALMDSELTSEASVKALNQGVATGDSPTFAGVTLATADINAGSIDGTAIGASSASTGAFTTLTASGIDVTGTASATNVSLPDDGVLSLGTSDELTLKHHNSGYSHLINTTGTLYVDSDSVTFRDDDGSPSNMVISQTGIDVTGTANVGVSRITGQNLAHSASTLAIGHEGSSKSQLRAYGANSSTTGSLEFMVSNSSGGGSHSMVLDSSGNVGVGTSAIMQDFGSGRTTLALKGAGSADYSTLQLGNYGTSSNGQIHGLINFYDGTTSVSRIHSVRASNASDADLVFYTAPSSGGITERMRINASGYTSFTLGTNAKGTFSDAIGEVGSGNFALQATNSAGSALKPMGFRAEDIRFATGSTERMRIHASGAVTKPYQPSTAFCSTSTVTLTNDSTWRKLALNKIIYETGGSNFSTSNNRFTAPVAGRYLFGMDIQLESVSGTITWMYIVPFVNGAMNYAAGAATADFQPPAQLYNRRTGTFLLNLSANDYVDLYHIGAGNGTVNVKGYAESAFFLTLL